jgi:hypothetical protein
MEVAVRLIRHKLTGQAAIARVELRRDSVADTIDDLSARLADSATLEEVRQLEAAAANVYWNAWSDVTVEVVKRDRERVPSNWHGFDGRKSAIGPYSARNATDPINALLNYSYKLLEAEGVLAARSVGLDPGMGVLHADIRGRQSMVLDLIEAARPIADRHVLRLVRSHPMRWRDFVEDRRGVVRVLAPLTHRLAEAMPSYATAMAPIVQEVADVLAASSPYDVSIPKVLGQERHREMSRRSPASGRTARAMGPGVEGVLPRKSQRQRPLRAQESPALPSPTCVSCGRRLTREPDRRGTRARYCTECIPERRVEIGRMIQAMSKEPRKASAETTSRRVTANRARRLGELEWSRLNQAFIPSRDQYIDEIQPTLTKLSLTSIARATGLSTSMASRIRSGKRIPHPMHWDALRRLST